MTSLAAALAAPSIAGAATTISRTGNTITITGDDTASRLVNGSITDSTFTDELGGTVTPAGGCAMAGPSAVNCGAVGPADVVIANLGGGDDFYKFAGDPVQTINGEGGNDTIETGYGNDTVNGGPGNDDLTGGRGDDTMDGGEGNDKVDGWDGNDTVTGGPGADNLLGDGGTVYSGGADKIFARDGENDTVDCGGGADSAQVDAGDIVAGCASIDRPATAPVGGGSTPGPGGSAPGPGGTTPAAELALSGKVSKTQRLGALASGKKITLTLSATAACTGKAAIAITKAEAKKRKLGTKALTLGTSRSAAIPTDAAGVAVKLAIDAKHRKRLKSISKLSATVVIACLDGSGRTAEGALALSLKR